MGEMSSGHNIGMASGSKVVVEETVIIWVCRGGGQAAKTMHSIMSTAAMGAVATHTASYLHHIQSFHANRSRVIVGGSAGLFYTPESRNAVAGDRVVFTFMSYNHTATQCTFTKPCEAMAGGMDTGSIADPNNTINPPPHMAMQIKVATPHVSALPAKSKHILIIPGFFCGQKNHCGQGMTFSIQPAANKTQEMFKQMAIIQNG